MHRQRRDDCVRGVLFDFRAAGIAEAQQLCDFVERLAGGVVDCSSNDLIIADTANEYHHRVTTADHERNIRSNFRFAEKWREQMTFEMIDREIRFTETDGETFRDRCSNH